MSGGGGRASPAIKIFLSYKRLLASPTGSPTTLSSIAACHGYTQRRHADQSVYRWLVYSACRLIRMQRCFCADSRAHPQRRRILSKPTIQPCSRTEPQSPLSTAPRRRRFCSMAIQSVAALPFRKSLLTRCRQPSMRSSLSTARSSTPRTRCRRRPG